MIVSALVVGSWKTEVSLVVNLATSPGVREEMRSICEAADKLMKRSGVMKQTSKNGFIQQWNSGPFDGTETVKANAEIASKKNSFEYFELSNSLKFGLPQYHIQATHYYRRSYLEKQIIEPFIHEKRNLLAGGIYLYPDPDISMTVTTIYDARSKLLYNSDRLKDISVDNKILFDINRIFYGKESSSNRNTGLFYSGIELSNKYTFISKIRTSGYNTFDIKYTTGNFAFPWIKKINYFDIGYNFYHDYRYMFRDTMSAYWQTSAEFRLFRVELGANSMADRPYLLYNNSKAFAAELKRSLFFYDKQRSKNAVFSLRNFYVNIIHDLHCWEIGFYYNLQRNTEYIGSNNRTTKIYYDHAFFISLTFKNFPEAGFQKMQVYPIEKKRESEY